jgi:hypothetical protein
MATSTEYVSMFSPEFYKSGNASFRDIMNLIVDFCRENPTMGMEALEDLYYYGEIHMIPFEHRFALAEIYNTNKVFVKFMLIDLFSYYSKFDAKGFPVPETKPNTPETYMTTKLIPKLKEKYNTLSYNENILYTITENIDIYLKDIEVEQSILKEMDKSVRAYIKKPEYSRLVSTFAMILSNRDYKGYEKPLNKSLKKIMTGK